MSETSPNMSDQAANIASQARSLSEKAAEFAMNAAHHAPEIAAKTGGHDMFLLSGLTVFVLACFVGYYVVWRVTPALHSPLMGITNAISSVIIVGAVLAVGPAGDFTFSKMLGFLAVILASINIFGGFIITRRMLHMFNKK